ncbi:MULTISPECIES: carboxylating nicotinate-nucleotide diphosphorylase [unclassified Methylophilus]|uniref:carboxylating nicotinate-nucleotide diphosphorylase n=1 Tax=unclassified Methylophilus TaxID=2630143 RepID=UPI0006F65144|nr:MULTISPECIES: carboxylating nicotinate-nucleotide diphosphorylase [unclassified Methylophilus]KQT42301.1 nicotinate-nucleotide pyrophosphorylase [Methylophilus sp. Leaf416]KQT56483.1 nicotinate-nucleotide pyrophosphorylase [Methylophilus sp. Leaf459]
MTQSSIYQTLPPYLNAVLIAEQVKAILQEDIGKGDITAHLIPSGTRASATIISREQAVICGCAWVEQCFTQLDSAVSFDWHVKDGDLVQPNQTLVTIEGDARAMLSAERPALNFLQTLSAVATHTRQYAELIAGLPAKVLDTRKTLPGLRLAQKYAVLTGGGANQRLALYDGILIKENHITAAGSIASVLKAAFDICETENIQIEVETLDELQQALDAGAKSILLDNFTLNDLRKAVTTTQKRALLEASGNVDLTTVRAIAETGVDRISIGGLTKHIQAVDLSMRIQMQI